MGNYKPIPIEVAKQISDQYDKDQVIILTWDNENKTTHCTTYGKTQEDAEQAANGGNTIKKHLGFPEEACHDVPKKKDIK